MIQDIQKVRSINKYKVLFIVVTININMYKVFKTKGNKSKFVVKRKEYERARRNYMSSHNVGKAKKNSQDKTFDWPEIMSAWLKAAETINELTDSPAACGGWGNCQQSSGDSFNQTSGRGGREVYGGYSSGGARGSAGRGGREVYGGYSSGGARGSAGCGGGGGGSAGCGGGGGGGGGGGSSGCGGGGC
ncbi:hypothetical protein EDC94DRAFT_268277 [Helicostylum pulchrum]|nr:hypothetical protein EDC94DRAFT_268277 [Helicostylum pulchrum]